MNEYALIGFIILPDAACNRFIAFLCHDVKLYVARPRRQTYEECDAPTASDYVDSETSWR